MNKKIGIGLCSILALTAITTGCGKEAKLDDSEKNAVSLKGIEITATDYYNEIKENNISRLVDMIDHQLFDEEYPRTDEEDQSVKDQIDQLKETYGSNDQMFEAAIQQYFGVEDEKELEDMFRLEFKRSEAVEDYVADNISKKDIEDYYDKNIIGDIKASHILITPDVDSDATDEEKEKAEKAAKKEAKSIIKELDEGKDFATLAKKYSDDTATKADGGDLGYFNTDDMDDNFIEAVKELKNDEYTEKPVKTQYGYHIILKVDQKEKPKLKKVREEIKTTLAEAKLENNTSLHYQTLKDIREDKNIKWNDSKLEKQYEELMDQLIQSSTTTN